VSGRGSSSSSLPTRPRPQRSVTACSLRRDPAVATSPRRSR
jgi:hypothetical protein